MSQVPTDLIADRGFSQAPVYRTDLHRCRPAEALSDRLRFRHWRVLPYATDHLNGHMLMGGPETAAPTIIYPLEAQGWHAISIGVMPVRPPHEGRELEIQLKLSDERVFTMLTLGHESEVPHRGRAIVELFWRAADLTGRDLEIAPVNTQISAGEGPGVFECGPVRLAYVKLVPLTGEERTSVQADQEHSDTRRLFAHQDSHGPHWLWRLTTEDEIRRELEPYRDTDFSRMYWEAGGGDELFYFTQLARIPTYDELDDFARAGDRRHAESWRSFRDQGVDPFVVAIDHTHAVGMEFHASWRVSGFHYAPPVDHINLGDTFYAAHQAWRGEDREGQRTPWLSYAYPGVRQYVIALLREMAQFPIDGVCLLYCRRLPVMEYEPPLVEEFRRKAGIDPRQLDPRDPDWIAFRAGTLTQFMREVREAMDDETRRQGRAQRIQVSATSLATEEDNLYRGLDLRTWISEGLVDTLIPYSSDRDQDSSVNSWTDPESLAEYVDLVRGTPVVLAPNVMPRNLSPAEFRRRAATIYAAGADHLFFWDCAGPGGRANYRPMWNALRRLGHREEIQAWQAAGEPSLDWPVAPLRRWSDWDLTYTDAG